MKDELSLQESYRRQHGSLQTNVVLGKENREGRAQKLALSSWQMPLDDLYKQK